MIKKRIVHYTIGFHNPPQGGVEIAIRDIACMTSDTYEHIVLVKYGNDEYRDNVFVTSNTEHEESTYCENFIDRIPKDFIDNHPKKDYCLSRFFDETTIDKIKTLKPDILIVYGNDDYSMLIPLTEIQNVKKYVRVQDFESHRYHLDFYKQHTDGVIVFAEKLYNDYQNNGNKVFLIHKAYNDTIFNSYSRKCFTGNKYIYTGRFSEEKRLPLLIDCFNKYKTHNDSLTLIGLAQNQFDYINIVNAINKNPNNIYLQGWMNHQQLAETYKHSDVVIIPSIYETFCSSALEALACGCLLVINNRTMEWADGLCINGANLVSQEEYPNLYFSNPLGLDIVMNKVMNKEYCYDLEIAQTVKEKYAYSLVKQKWSDLFSQQ